MSPTWNKIVKWIKRQLFLIYQSNKRQLEMFVLTQIERYSAQLTEEMKEKIKDKAMQELLSAWIKLGTKETVEEANFIILRVIKEILNE